MIRLSPAIMVLWNMAAAIKMSDDSLTFLCINCQVNFHANAGWCRAEGHDVTWRRPPLVAACILKPLHDCYSSLRMMLHPCWWGLASYHNLFDVSFWIRSNEPPPWAHKRKILAKWMLPRHQIPKPWSPTDTSKWRSLSPDSWWFSDEGLYVSNIESFKKRHEQCQESKWVGWFLHPETERKGIPINLFNPIFGPPRIQLLFP